MGKVFELVGVELVRFYAVVRWGLMHYLLLGARVFLGFLFDDAGAGNHFAT